MRKGTRVSTEKEVSAVLEPLLCSMWACGVNNHCVYTYSMCQLPGGVHSFTLFCIFSHFPWALVCADLLQCLISVPVI